MDSNEVLGVQDAVFILLLALRQQVIFIYPIFAGDAGEMI